MHDHVLPIVEGVLDAGCLVSSLSSIRIQPGETAQPIHADDQLMPLTKPHAPTVCNSMWALTDFTDANGATRIIPGTHLAADSPDFGSTYDSIPAEMPRGSVLVWHGSLWHGGGANATDDDRIGIAMNYCAGWVRQQENQQLGHPDRRRPHVLAPPARALRVRRLQHAHRPHQQALPGRDPRRRPRIRPHGLGRLTRCTKDPGARSSPR